MYPFVYLSLMGCWAMICCDSILGVTDLDCTVCKWDWTKGLGPFSHHSIQPPETFIDFL